MQYIRTVRMVVLIAVVSFTVTRWSSLVGLYARNVANVEISQAAVKHETQLGDNPGLDRALRALDFAIGLSEADTPAQVAAVRAYVLSDNQDGAATALDSWVSTAPDDWLVLVWLIRLADDYSRKGHDSEGKHIEELIAQQAEKSYYRSGASIFEGEALHIAAEANRDFRRKDYVLAEKRFELVQAVSPWLGLGYYGLGDVYAAQRRWNEAIASYQKGLNVDKRPLPGLARIGRVYLSQESAENADELLVLGEEALRRGSWEWGHFMIGRALQWEGQSPAAMEHYREVTRRYHTEPETVFAIWYSHFYLASIYQVQGDMDVAVSYYHQAAEISHEYGWDARALFYAASALRTQGEVVQAVGDLKRALQLIDEEHGQDALRQAIRQSLWDACGSLGFSDSVASTSTDAVAIEIGEPPC